jgi:hypothetical protein
MHASGYVNPKWSSCVFSVTALDNARGGTEFACQIRRIPTADTRWGELTRARVSCCRRRAGVHSGGQGRMADRRG